MKRRVFAGTILTLFLVVALFSAVPAKPQFVGVIKIGAMGPMPWIQGKGIEEGAKLAAKQINTAGGVVVSSGAWKVEVISADTLRGLPVPIYYGGTHAALELVAAGVDFAIGGYRTEAVYGAREVFMDAAIADDKPIFFIAGATTNELVDCGTGTCGWCVRCNYDRYRYTFRVAPMNSTMYFNGIAAYLADIMAAKLAPIYTGYATPLKIAVISEDLTWADLIHAQFTSETFWNTIMNMTPYGRVSVVYSARVSPVATDVSAELLAAQAASARLIIEVLSGPVGNVLPIQWRDLGIKALLAGINVPGQEIPLHWERTGGGCEYESFLATAGTRTPVSPQMTAFWDAYEAEYGHAPIFTSYGAYDTVMAIKETIEAAGKWPMGAREMVPHFEKTYRPLGMPAMLGTFKFTGPHPMSSATYDTYMANATHSYLDINPTMMGTLHDVFMRPEELGAMWHPPYYTRPFVVQWQRHPVTEEHRLEVVYPINMNFSKRLLIPAKMYKVSTVDLWGPNSMPDGLVDAWDLGLVAAAWLSQPGDPGWEANNFGGLNADQDGNSVINIADLAAMAQRYGYNATADPDYGQWPLGDP